MEKTYSIKEVIELTADMLREISIPVEYAEQIGIPVMHAIKNLKVVQKTIEAQEVAKEIQDETGTPEEGENNG